MEPEDKWGENAIAQQKALIQLGESKRLTAIPYLLTALRARNHEPVSSKAGYALSNIGTPAIPVLVEVIRSKNEVPAVKMQAIKALGHIRHRSAFPPLLEALKHEDAGIRQYAAGALGMTGKRGALPHLVKTMLNDSDSRVAETAARSLGMIGHQSSLKPLTKAVATDYSPQVKASACWALGELRDPAVIPLLIWRVKERPEVAGKRTGLWYPDVRDAAAEALYKIVEKGKTRNRVDENVKKLLLVHGHVRPRDPPQVKAHAYLDAFENRVSEKNARLYLKQLRALEGSLK